MTKDELMRKAIELSIDNVNNGGGPFGAVIARDGEIVATGVNRVTANNDPTAHAEVSAIRAAAAALGTFDLSDCEIFTSCEPVSPYVPWRNILGKTEEGLFCQQQDRCQEHRI